MPSSILESVTRRGSWQAGSREVGPRSCDDSSGRSCGNLGRSLASSSGSESPSCSPSSSWPYSHPFCPPSTRTQRWLIPNVSFAIAVVYIPTYFRVIRNHVASVKEEPFVEAAIALGLPRRRVIGRYILPNVAQSIPVIFSVNAADAVLTEAGLAVLGLG